MAPPSYTIDTRRAGPIAGFRPSFPFRGRCRVPVSALLVLPAMPSAATKRSLDKSVKIVMAKRRKLEAEQAAAERRGRIGQKKVQIWLSAADAHALKLRALNEDTTTRALVAQAVRALLHG